MSDLTIFNFHGRDVRISGGPDDLWFVATDLCEPLGYRMASDMTRILDDDEKGTHIVSTPGGPQEVAVISEPGVYKLVARSRKQQVKDFDRFIRHEVLPQVRRTGMYAPAVAAMDPRQMGGIMKAVVRAQIKEAITELAPQIIAAQLAADPRVAAIRAVTALEIAQDEGVPRKGRHPIVVSISKRLKRYCLARGHDPDKQPGKSAKLFPVEYAYAWLREEGREFIRRRIADAAEPAPLFAIRGGKH
ncbi:MULTISPECIES: BRO family protein [unclassified Azospirillum]|uniref:BRO-N domain-containing protein n=1 Tax=unclassified Azospirillum TaxID=2630922 RepID=UPI000D65CAE3|nr:MULTISPECIES: BRO family protein [unclassified Azospirillum]